MRSNFKILIVDDDETLLWAVTRALEKNGYQTLAAKTGREALKRIDETPPDLVVCDLVLPDTHGHRLAEEIQKKLQAEQPLFLFISGVNYNDDEVAKGFELGAIDFISKPFRMNELLRRVHSVFRIIELEREKRIAEEEQQQAREKEISSWGELSQEKTGFTKSVYEENVFQGNNQPLISSLESGYRNVIEKAVEARIYKINEDRSSELAALGERFGFLKATPRDVIKIHKNVFKLLAQNENPKKVSLFIEESRLILLELMGYLANYYRNRI